MEDVYSQEKKILAFLRAKKGNSLTRKECEQRGWGLERPARVWYLRNEQGWNIVSKRVNILDDAGKVRGHYNRYYMGDPERLTA